MAWGWQLILFWPKADHCLTRFSKNPSNDHQDLVKTQQVTPYLQNCKSLLKNIFKLAEGLMRNSLIFHKESFLPMAVVSNINLYCVNPVVKQLKLYSHAPAHWHHRIKTSSLYRTLASLYGQIILLLSLDYRCWNKSIY